MRLQAMVRRRGWRAGSAAASLAVGLALILGVNGKAVDAAALSAFVSGASVSSGNNQVSGVNTSLGRPLVIQATTANEPAPGAVVTWRISGAPTGANGQALAFGNTMTDVDGRSSNNLSLGSIAGRYTVVATVVGLESIPVTFTATAGSTASISPTLTGPTNGATMSTLGGTLTWTNPSGALQYEIMVVPFNNDGPGIHLIRNAEESYTIAAPNFGASPGNYVMLPGMSYMWQVRTTAVPDPSPSDWSSWASSTFRTPVASSATITLNGMAGATTSSLNPTLSWTDSNRQTFYYEVQVSQDSSFTTNPAAARAMVYWELRHGALSDPENSYTIPSQFPLADETVYFWRVRPRVQGDGTPVAWSPTMSFQTRTANPE